MSTTDPKAAEATTTKAPNVRTYDTSSKATVKKALTTHCLIPYCRAQIGEPCRSAKGGEVPLPHTRRVQSALAAEARAAKQAAKEKAAAKKAAADAKKAPAPEKPKRTRSTTKKASTKATAAVAPVPAPAA